MPQLWGLKELLVTKLQLGLPAARLPRAWQAGNRSEISLRLKAPPENEGLHV